MNKKKLTIIIFILSLLAWFIYFFNFRVQRFNNLKAINSYVSGLEELVEPNIDRYDRPDFSNFFEKNKKSGISNFLNKVIKRSWNVELFSNLLNKTIKDRETFGYKGDFVLRIMPTKNIKFILWGDIYGALHSLTRDLIELNRIGIIDDNLKIKDSECYFVFNGEFTGKSPYSLETLTILFRLMEQNPHQIFCIKGKEGLFGLWQNYGLKMELRYKAKYFSNEIVPFENKLNEFFNTLPLALFIGISPDNFYDYIKIYHLDSDEYGKLNIKKFAGLLVEKDDVNNNVKIINLDQGKVAVMPPVVKVRITKFQDGLEENEGLDIIPEVKGAKTWVAFSSPTLIHQRAIKFFYDIFSIFYPKDDFSDWIITKHFQDSRLKDGFEQKDYNFLTGKLLDWKD